MHEQYLKQDLAGVQVYKALPEMDNWEERAIEHLMNLQTGMSALGADPMSEEDVKEYFQLKRDIVLALVEKVLIGKDREMKVIFKLDVLSLLGIDINSTSSGRVKRLIHSYRRKNRSEFVTVNNHALFTIGAQFAGHHFHWLADAQFALVHVGELGGDDGAFF